MGGRGTHRNQEPRHADYSCFYDAGLQGPQVVAQAVPGMDTMANLEGEVDLT